MWKYVNRNNNDALVLIPGWATDYRIFDSLDLRFNYLLPVNFSPFNFEKTLLETLKENRIEKVSLFGWSMGGFIAAEFAYKHPNFIDQLILVSVRKRYNQEELLEIKKHLKKSKEGYLYKFYTQCFASKERLHWFKKNLLRYYCQVMDLDYLLNTLDYLKNAQIKPESLKDIKGIKIIHGECDNIAPVKEAVDIKKRLPQARFISIKDAGHIPFLKEDFARYVD